MLNPAFDQTHGLQGVFGDHIFAQHLDSQPNASQGVLDFVGQLRGRLADRGQRRTTPQSGLGLGRFSHIHQREDLTMFAVDLQRR